MVLSNYRDTSLVLRGSDPSLPLMLMVTYHVWSWASWLPSCTPSLQADFRWAGSASLHVPSPFPTCLRTMTTSSTRFSSTHYVEATTTTKRLSSSFRCPTRSTSSFILASAVLIVRFSGSTHRPMVGPEMSKVSNWISPIWATRTLPRGRRIRNDKI